MKNQLYDQARPFGLRDKLGYMFGDFGNDFTFIFASSFLMVFYTKVLGIASSAVGVLFLVARFVDAVTDITMGRIVDTFPTAKDGRFRPWIRRMAGPVAIASFLMYQSQMANASMAWKMIYMYVTYLLWGSVFYTSINIPYGSMASAISPESDDRTALSTFRGIGASLASLIIGVGGPLILYITDEEGNKIVDGGRFTLVAGVFSVLAIICYIICYFSTTERVKIEPKAGSSPKSMAQVFLGALRNKALLAIIGTAIGMLLSQLFIQSLNNYLYADYFRNTEALALFNIIVTVISLALAAVTLPLTKKYGKKETAVTAILLSGTVYLLLFLFRIGNAWLFLGLSGLGYIGISYFNLIVWSQITDVIDHQEVMTGERDDGTIYSIYSFARKVGQALAGGLGGFALSLIGYDELARVQSDEVLRSLYTAVTLLPAVCFFLTALILGFLYPLNKKRTEKNGEILRRKKRE